MLKNIVNFKDNIWSWRILSIIPVLLFSSALFFQHVLEMEPCVLCIDQRIGIIGIFIGGIIPLIFGLKNQITKLISYIFWLSGSLYGLWAAGYQWYENYQADSNPYFMSQCGQGLEQYFPWIMDSKILTDVFIAKGICTEIDWSFMGFEMHHWMVLFFSCFLLSGIFYSAISLIQKIKK